MGVRILIVGAGGQGLIVADILLGVARRGASPIGAGPPPVGLRGVGLRGAGLPGAGVPGARPRTPRDPPDVTVAEDALEPIGFLDDDPQLAGRRVLGLEVLGTRAALRTIPHDAVIVAIGDNARREAVSRELARDGVRLIAACHPHASVAPDAEIGAGCMLSAGVVVTPGVRLGRGVILNTACSVDHQSVIGDFAHVGPGATVGADVTIGDRTLIGLGASVMSGRRIGADTVVGAAALVTRDLPDSVVATGVPARITRPRR